VFFSLGKLRGRDLTRAFVDYDFMGLVLGASQVVSNRRRASSYATECPLACADRWGAMRLAFSPRLKVRH
jgi:hypothetical protein